MDVRLYVIPASHPATTAKLMLEYKGIPYKRTDLMPGIHKAGAEGAADSRATRCRR